jgi:NTP pyrophosphatase (non-canonical NTP hydrolase)
MDLAELTAEMHRFVEEKGWYDADSPKPQSSQNLAISLSVEAAEVLELFQWTNDAPATDALASELADVLLYLLQLASISGVDLEQAALNKLRENYERSW